MIPMIQALSGQVLRDTGIENTSPLGKLFKLTNLDLRGTLVRNFSPLAPLINLSYLCLPREMNCFGTAITTEGKAEVQRWLDANVR